MPNKLSQFWQELKRRKVIKVIAMYAGAAFVLIELTNNIVEPLRLPEWTPTLVILLLVIGFPITLILSWIFDVTPEGIRKTEPIEETLQAVTASAPAKRGLKVSDVMIAVLLIAVCILVYPKIFNQDTNNDSIETDEISNKLIAVLPFSNTKSDPETDYLGFAIADEIIGNLVYLKNITVRPSSSIRKYEKQVVDPVAAADDLQVNYLLNGSYLKEADKIRLNIELVELNTNKMIWRESIEVDFNSSFELLDIVAQKAVEGLNIQFSQKDLARIEKDIPNDPLAYEYYLKSISLPLTDEGNRLAIEMLNQSIELDSSYAPAYAQLGTRIYILTMFGLRDQEDTRKAEYLFLKSLTLNSDYIYALSRLAWLYTERGNIEEAVQLSRKILEINPNHPEAHFSLGYIYRYAGMNKEAIQEMETAVTIDPSNQEFRSIGLTYMYIGDYEKSYEIFQKFEPTSYALYLQGNLLLRMGQRDQAVDFLNQAADLDPDGLIGLRATGMKAYIEGDFKTGLDASYRIEEVNIIDGEHWYHSAVDYALLGEEEGCIRALRRAIDGGFFNYPLMLSDPFLDSMRDNTEFKELLQQANEMHLSFIRKYF